MHGSGSRRTNPDQMSGSLNTIGTTRHSSITNPILSKRVCFYKNGDPQFGGLRMVINNRTFKTFDALLDSLSKKVPLPFGVRNITTPRGVHGISTLEELEDGKSYICSDRRRVKPMNLALARKKPKPWLHARPASSRRRTVQQARMFPGQSAHRKEPVAVRTPKRLLVFRNGDPSVKHTVVLQRRTTPTFPSILEYISELLQCPVIKLYTSDGRRVDGLASLVLCSGIVIAAGREAFWPANYTEQKPTPPKKKPTSRVTIRRLKALNRKKKSLPFASESRIFSPSSQKYIVNQIHQTMGKRSSDNTSYQTNSRDLESSHLLSVAEMESLNHESEEINGLVPSEEDIEKSFRVNQDGSMTVEMKVRLTIKEEETLHWTTTVSRSTLANQLKVDSLPDIELEKQVNIPASDSDYSVDPTNPYKTKDDFDDDPPPLANRVVTQNDYEEDSIKMQMSPEPSMRTASPGLRHVRKKQASIESVRSMTADGIYEDTVGSYSYSERTEDGNRTEQYCMVRQSSTRPVPKPRRIDSFDAHSANRAFKSGEMIQTDSSREDVTETVLQIYEQRPCQDNFLANICKDDGSMSGMSYCRTSTSDTGKLSSTDYETTSTWKNDNLSLVSEFTIPTLQNGAVVVVSKKHKASKNSPVSEEKSRKKAPKDNRIPSKPKKVKKQIRRLRSPMLRQKGNPIKTFSSAGFIRGIYGNKAKPKRKKKKATQNKNSNIENQSQNGTKQVRNLHEHLLEEETEMEISETSQSRTTLKRQTSLHPDMTQKTMIDINQKMPVQDCTSSNNVCDEYVKNWIYKVQLGSNDMEITESGKLGHSENLLNVSQGVKCLEENIKSNNSFKVSPPPQNLMETSVKQRIKSFEYKLTPENQSAAVKPCLNGMSKTNDTENDEEFPPPPAETLFEEKITDSLGENCHLSHTLSVVTLTPNVQNSELKEEKCETEPALSRSTSIKRVPLVSNQSLERKMSLRKACLDKGLDGDVQLEVATTHSELTESNVMVNGISSEEEKMKADSRELSSDQTSSRSCTSMSPSSQISDDCASSVSLVSSEPSIFKNTPKKILSPKKSRPEKSPSSERKLKNDSSNVTEFTLPKSLVSHKSPNPSPSTKKKKTFSKSKQPSPYSQSLDMTSPPARKNPGLSRTLSSGGSSDHSKEEQGKTKSTESSESTNVGTKITVDEEHPKNQVTKPVLDRICCSIKAVQQGRQSCGHENGPSDFSSHVESTFGSSSQVLLTFLSIMTLKDSLTKKHVEELNTRNVSSTEAFKMICSLGQMSAIEDSSQLKENMLELQMGASGQLMENWKEFCSKNRGEIITQLDLPESLMEELASLDSKVNNNYPNKSVDIRYDSQQVAGAEIKQLKQIEIKEDDLKSESNRLVGGGEEGLYRQSSDSNLPPIMPNAERSSKEREEAKGPKQLCRKEVNDSSEGAETQPELKSDLISNSSDFVFKGRMNHGRRGSGEILKGMYDEDSSSDCTYDKSGSEDGRRLIQSEHETSCMGREDVERTEVECGEAEQNDIEGNVSCPVSPSEEEEHDYLRLNANRKESVRDKEHHLLVGPQNIENRRINECINEVELELAMTSCNKLNVIIEETLCGKEEEQDQDEILHQYCKKDNVAEEVDKEKNPQEMSRLENQDQDSLSQRGSDTEDSGNDHRSSEEQIVNHHVEAEHIRSSPEEETSAYGEECRSDEEAVVLEIHKDKTRPEEKPKETEDIITQTVAERVNILEKQVAEAKRKLSTTESFRSYAQRNGNLVSDTRSIPPSSLSFSYDSSGVITTEPESNKVRSIREMFLARSSNEIAELQKNSANAMTMSDLRLDTSTSAGYQSQTSSELSSEEEEVATKSISKGFVRRTIERLYGRTNTHNDDDEKDRPKSATKQKTDHSSTFSPFHAARTMPEMSYFNSTNVLNTLTEATGCFAFNVQVEPAHHIDADGWLARENSLIRKSVSDPIGISKNVANRSETSQNLEETPHSNSEPEDNQQSQYRKCTYFSLPHMSDSDTVQDEASVSKRTMNGDVVSEAKPKTQVCPEKKAAHAGDFKKKDNKVHPLVEAHGEVVVKQPVKEQTVAHRHHDPDMLDFIYNFCGENCPIL